jgi:hypothetical protein
MAGGQAWYWAWTVGPVDTFPLNVLLKTWASAATILVCSGGTGALGARAPAAALETARRLFGAYVWLEY